MKRATPHISCFPRKSIPRLLSLLAGVILFAATSAPAADSAPSFSGSLTFQNGTLTARIAAAPLQQVMAEISKLSGAQVRWLNAGGQEPVSVEFRALSVEEALRRILPRQNFLLLYSAEKLSQIWITSPGQGGGQPTLISRPVAVAPPPREETQESEQESEETKPEEQAQDAAQQLDAALEVAQTSREAAQRVETIEMLQGQAKEDPRILATLTQLAAGDDDPAVRAAAAAALEQQQ